MGTGATAPGRGNDAASQASRGRTFGMASKLTHKQVEALVCELISDHGGDPESTTSVLDLMALFTSGGSGSGPVMCAR